MGGEDDDAPIAVDLRQDWIAEKVCETLKIKKDKFDNSQYAFNSTQVCKSEF